MNPDSRSTKYFCMVFRQAKLAICVALVGALSACAASGNKSSVSQPAFSQTSQATISVPPSAATVPVATTNPPPPSTTLAATPATLPPLPVGAPGVADIKAHLQEVFPNQVRDIVWSGTYDVQTTLNRNSDDYKVALAICQLVYITYPDLNTTANYEVLLPTGEGLAAPLAPDGSCEVTD